MIFSVQIKAARGAAILAALLLLSAGCNRGGDEAAGPAPNSNASANTNTVPTVELTDNQLDAIKIGTVGTYLFSVTKTGTGSIDFANNLYSDANLSTQVFPPVEGKILKVFVELGDEVQKDAPLYSVESSGTNRDEIIVRSPLAGQVASVNLTVGLTASPSNGIAPCAVADVSTKWLLANVSEADTPAFQAGQKVEIKVAAFPDRGFSGTVSKIYPAVDLTTHRLTLRAEISDPDNVLRAGMLADFSISVQAPVESAALPENGVVREGDGTLTAWTTTDRKHFVQKIIKVGLRENGEAQILDGLQTGELAVTDGAIFLDNILNAAPGD